MWLERASGSWVSIVASLFSTPQFDQRRDTTKRLSSCRIGRNFRAAAVTGKILAASSGGADFGLTGWDEAEDAKAKARFQKNISCRWSWRSCRGSRPTSACLS